MMYEKAKSLFSLSGDVHLFTAAPGIGAVVVPVFGRRTFEQVKIIPKRSLGYGYQCGYSPKAKLLVIFSPVIDSHEAVGL